MDKDKRSKKILTESYQAGHESHSIQSRISMFSEIDDPEQ